MRQENTNLNEKGVENPKSKYAIDLMIKVIKFRIEIGSIPEGFHNIAKKNRNHYEILKYYREKKIPTTKEIEDLQNFLLYKNLRPEGVGFDINRFLDVFDKIKLKKNVVLDYAYDFNGSNARPYIYTRYNNGIKITPYNFEKLYRLKGRPYLKDIIIEKDFKSFLQLVVFSVVIHQFYLKWHAAYNDHKFIFSQEELRDILSSITQREGRSGINNEEREKLKKLSLQPIIDIKEENAECSCVMFSKWKGFYYKNSLISYPNISIENKIDLIVPYHCGIWF